MAAKQTTTLPPGMGGGWQETGESELMSKHLPQPKYKLAIFLPSIFRDTVDSSIPFFLDWPSDQHQECVNPFLQRGRGNDNTFANEVLWQVCLFH
jgi:hypothetical protein